ncbi:MAG: cache domain-containing protein [Chloroflexota bacterium]|nr:MAG: cache domain-containing protein [Chloroflexota bacterium]
MSVNLTDYQTENKVVRLPIATKLLLSFLIIVAFISIVYMVVGIQLISNRILAEAQDKVRHDLNAARELYLGELERIDTTVRLTADRFFLKEAIVSGELQDAYDELWEVRKREDIDILELTDEKGIVILRTRYGDNTGDDLSGDIIIKSVLESKESVASTVIVPGKELQRESPFLAQNAHFTFIETPLAREREETEEADGMMLKAAYPVFDQQNNILGVLYGGTLLNRNFDIVDKVKETVYEGIHYKGKDIGTVTIFQDDVRISTNVTNEDGSRALGTRVTEEVYNQVVINGEPWIGRAYVVNDWYITAYEPIRDLANNIIGILYVGILEEKYTDIQRGMILTFLAITIAGALVSLVVSYFFAQRMLVPIFELVNASKAVASGNLNAKVEISTNDELEELADSFNAMAEALQKRDKQLREFATQKIMESEKLALIGQLSANVAHELNNPLTGIVTYSHLILENSGSDDPNKSSIEKIVGQATRCRDIIRGLLDFSRQRKPDKVFSNINTVVEQCISFVENQALFHNIEIIKNFQEDLPMIVIDPSQIERVIMNIIINAAEAMEGEGELIITTRSNIEKDAVVLEFKDTGPGIGEENIDKIFDPFFTTKDVGHGTGLGLAISYGVVKAHNGSISVESELGKGTTFIVRLPEKVLDEVPDNGNVIENINN